MRFKKKYYYIIFTSIITMVLTSCLSKDTGWQMASTPIKSQWADKIDPKNPWPEYPRPQMVRKKWKNLNGLWNYAIRPADQAQPTDWDGRILVPYPVESALSGVKKQIGKDSLLWYLRKFSIPKDWYGKRILLHFEAVDWKTTVWINGKKAGTHKGGYDPFTFDITGFLNKTGDQKLVLSVWDPTDDGTQPRGKQVRNPHGIWYTPTTGIWQTVWLEPVPESYIFSFQVSTDIDNKLLSLKTDTRNIQKGDQVKAIIYFDNQLIGESNCRADSFCNLTISDLHLWSPGNPNLYDLSIQLIREGKIIDKVESYFGMRKISLGKDKQGFTRIFLNNEFVFQNGPLDQGFWPDGLYTPPTDEAMKYDLEMTRKLGFNMLRKHVKVEPRRFYYWCDKLGILVWQDMPSGDRYIGSHDPDIKRTQESSSQFEYELEQMITSKFNHPCIVMWVPFNEGWGQYNTAGLVDFIKNIDPTRLVNNTSGWADRGVGDVLDLHHYPEPVLPEPEQKRAIVLGEFGGLGYPVPEHTWVEKNWGYQNMKDTIELINKYEEFYANVWNFMEQGLSASVYTQITDVETETNGLLTYDRTVVKVDMEHIYKINTNTFVPAP